VANNPGDDRLDDTVFKDQDLSGMDFRQAELADAVFENCTLIGTNFRSANLAGARFDRCHLFDPDKNLAADFNFATLTEAHFQHCDLTTVTLTHCRAYGLVLEHCQAQGSDLSRSDFTLPIGTDTGHAAFTMSHCNFAYGDLSNTYLKGCKLTDNRMVEALLHNCLLDGALFTGSDLSNISGRGMSLKGADLRGATFNNLDPREIDLDGVKITLEQTLWLLAPLGVEVDVGTDDPAG